MSTIQDRSDGRLRLNVMTVGQRGTGKATFLKSLVQNYADDNFTITKPVWRSEIPGVDERVEKVRVVEVGRTPVTIGTDLVDLVMYDSLGFGDFINNQDAVASIRNHVVESHAHWRNLDVQSMGAADVLNQDRRIHCLFYFFAAHSVRDIDLSFLAQLSGTVPIIPVVAKADTMTNDERNQYLSDLHKTIQDLSLSLNTPVTYDFNLDRARSDSQETDLPASHLDKNSKALKSGRHSRSPRHSFSEISDTIEYASGETSLESHLHTSHLYASADFDLDTSYSTTDYTYKNTSCAPSPEFVALISQSTEFGEGTGSVSSDDGNVLHETPLRSLSMCSIDSNENIADLNTHVMQSEDAPDRNVPIPSADSPVSWRDRMHSSRSPKIERELSYNYADDNSPDDDSNVETLFDKETFVNIGRALSDNAIFSQNHSSGSSEAYSQGAKDLSISSFEECEEDDDLDGGWSVLMDSTVLVGLPFEEGPPLLKGPQKTISPVAKPPHNRANEPTLDIPVPVEKMICKLVTSKICNSIAGEGERKVCKLVSKYVCEKLVSDTGLNDLDHSGLEGQEKEHMVTDGEERVDEAGRKSPSASPLCSRQNSAACETPLSPRESGVRAAHADILSVLSDSTPLERGNLPPFTISPGGRHIYTNIFAIANKKSALSDIKMGVTSVAGGADDEDSTSIQTQGAHRSSPVDLTLPLSPMHFSASASPVRHSVQWAETSHSPCSEDSSDMARLQLMIFSGYEIESLISKTKEYSIKLFPSKPASLPQLPSPTCPTATKSTDTMYGLQGISDILCSYYSRAVLVLLAIMDQVLAPAGTAFLSIIASSSLDAFERARSILRWAFYKSGLDNLQNIPSESDDGSFDTLPSSQAQCTANSTASEWTLTRFLSGLHSLQSVKLLSTVIASGLSCVGDRYSPLCSSLGQAYTSNDVSTQLKDTTEIKETDKSADRVLARSAEGIVDSVTTFHYSDAGDDLAVTMGREAAAANAPPIVCTCQHSDKRSPNFGVNPTAVTSFPVTAENKKGEAFGPRSPVAPVKSDSLKLSPWVIITQLAMMVILLLLSSGVLQTLTRTTVPVSASAPPPVPVCVPLSAIDTRVVSATAVLETVHIDESPAAHVTVSEVNTIYADDVDNVNNEIDEDNEREIDEDNEREIDEDNEREIDEDNGSDSTNYFYDSSVGILNYEVVSVTDPVSEEEEEVIVTPPSATPHVYVEDSEMSLSHRELYQTENKFEVAADADSEEESNSEHYRSKGGFRHYKSPGVSGAREREAEAAILEMEYYPVEYTAADYEYERENVREITKAMAAIDEDDPRLSIPLLHSVALCTTGLDVLGIDIGGFDRLNDCVENEMSRYDRRRGFSYSQMEAYERRRSTFFSSHEMKYSAHYDYVKKALQDAVTAIQSLIPRLIELWESFAASFEKSLMSSFAFFYF